MVKEWYGIIISGLNMEVKAKRGVNYELSVNFTPLIFILNRK